MYLIQKHLLKGTQEFELLDEEIRLKIKSPFKSKTNSVPYVILNPEPVTTGSLLEFHSKVKCGPLLSFYIDKPNKEEFTAFIAELKSRIEKEFGDFTGINNLS